MTASSAQWRLERLSPEVRESAEAAAMTQGVTLASWLARLVIDTCAAEGISLPTERIREPARDGGLSVVAVAARPQPLPFSPSAMAPSLKPATAAPAPSRPTVAAAPVPATSVPAPPVPAAAPNPIARLPGFPVPDAPVSSPAPPRVSAPVVPIVREPAGATVAAPSAPATVGEPQRSLDFAGTVTILPAAALEPGGCGTRGSDDQVPPDLITAIATDGLRQPLLVRRRRDSDGRYEIIAGARRWRAAQRIGLMQVPAIIADLDDAQSVLASLKENLHRGDLPPLDEARAYLRLLTQFSLSAVDVTKAINRDRQHVVRWMRLLGLPQRVREHIDAGKISTDHALLLLGAANAEQLGDMIVNEGLSQEETRRRLNATTEPPT